MDEYLFGPPVPVGTSAGGNLNIIGSRPATPGFRQVGVKHKGADGRTEFLWWESIPEGTPVYVRDADSATVSNDKS